MPPPAAKHTGQNAKPNDPKTDKGRFSFIKKMPKTERIAIGLTVIIIILAVGAIIYNHQKPSNSSEQVTPKQGYNKVVSFTLSGSKPGTALVFDKPTEFGDVTSGTLNAFFQAGGNVNKSSQELPVAQLVTSSTTLRNDYDSSYLDSLGKNIMSSNAENMRSVQPFLDYANSRIGKEISLKFVGVSNFTNTNIKNHAWAVEVTGSPTKSSDKSSMNLPDQQGKIILAYGKSTYYYFMVMTADNNWTANQASWQKVFDSIKIDQ